jgi:glycosyltransferase involved in cell wall biosynthesis
MKIWHLTKTLLGGAGQYALRLSNALRAAGFESTVLLRDGPGAGGALLLKRKDSPVRHFAARVFRSLSHRIALSPWHSIHGLELYKPPLPILPGDIIHLHGPMDWIGVTGLERFIPPHARVFQTVHGGWEISGGCVTRAGTECQRFTSGCARCPAIRTPWKSLARFELKTKSRFATKHRIRPIANSTWTAGMIRRSFVYRGVLDVPLIHPILHEAFLASDLNGLRSSLKISKRTRVIALGARAVTDRYKGIAAFLEQISALDEFASNTLILLFGDGCIHCPENLKVIDLGAVTEAEVAKILGASDVFVSPSSVESFGMLLIEAQAVGTPVVGFEVGGTRDAVFPGMAENLVPLRRWDLLFEKVSQVLKEPRREHPEVRAWTQKCFSASTITEKQLQCYGLSSSALV